MATKVPAKMMRVGIIRQGSTNGAAPDAYTAAGSTTNPWTNPGLAATNYRTVLYTKASPIPDPAITVDEYNVTSQLGLNYELTNRFIDARSGLAKLSFSGPVDLNTIMPHLVAVLQGANQPGSDNTIFTQGNVAGCIDFAAGSGYLHTIAIDGKASADDGTILENAILDNLTLTFDFLKKGVARLVQMSGTWVGNEMNFDQTLTGTWVATTLTPINNTAGFTLDTFTVDSVDWSALCIKRIIVNIKSNVTSNCATTAGKPNQYDLMPEITATIELDHNGTTEKIMGDFQSDATVDITMHTGTSGAPGYFALDMPSCKIMTPPKGYDGEYQSNSINVRAYQSSTTSPITITVWDGLGWGY